jgi:aminotransferase
VTVAIPTLTQETIPVYTSKFIANLAKADSRIANLAIGEPEFGPPEQLQREIEDLLSYKHFLRAVKSYEISRGLLSLRQAISDWYLRRYGLSVDPDTEILITHGGVEAISLAVLTTSNPGDTILLTDPTYMLYRQSIRTLARTSQVLQRADDLTYTGVFEGLTSPDSGSLKAILINSPENPTGYVLSSEEWDSISDYAQQHNLWVIHDEVYDTMSFTRPHIPAKSVRGLNDRSILINSCSKKFGVPGLRIGWMCAPKQIIDKAERMHDYLNLGVNALNEHIAEAFLRDNKIDGWLSDQSDLISQRSDAIVSALGSAQGYRWTQKPMGGMFAFPNIQELYERLPATWRSADQTPGESVALFLLKERQVAVVPGNTYGTRGDASFRMVLCSDKPTFAKAVASLSL